MENIFFNLTYTSLQQVLIRVLVFLLVSGLLVYVIYFILSKLTFRKTPQRVEISLRLAVLWSLFVFFMLFNLYLFVLFYHSGIDRFGFLSFRSFLGMMAQLVIFIGLVVFFLVARQALKKFINEKSIN
ncbi:MAG: hypothetical protein KFF73_12420 [Cyclobacteriaceae bacterium]|nr:hypothetical protein [Cyclobacteriaceae bacterium]